MKTASVITLSGFHCSNNLLKLSTSFLVFCSECNKFCEMERLSEILSDMFTILDKSIYSLVCCVCTYSNETVVISVANLKLFREMRRHMAYDIERMRIIMTNIIQENIDN